MTGLLTGGAVGFAGTSYSHYQYAGLFSFNDFHHCGRNGDDDLVNFNDRYELQNCELLHLADLDSGAPSVQEKQIVYLNHLLDLGVSGFRVDAAKHIAATDLRAIFSKLTRPNYRMLELIPSEPLSPGEYVPIGDVDNFAYAYSLGEAFHSGNLSHLPELGGNSGISSNSSVVFLENHDLERRPQSENLLTFHADPSLNRLGMAFLLTWPFGKPIVYSGYGFSDHDAGPPLNSRGFIENPICGAPFTFIHRAAWMQRLVEFHNSVGATDATDVWSIGPAVFAFGRGGLGQVVLSIDANPRTVDVVTRLAPGRYCNLAADEPESNCGSVNSEHILHVTLAPKSAFVTVAKSMTGTAKSSCNR
jgi:alpha-amylase